MSDLNVDDQWSDDWADEFDTVSQPLVLTRSVSNVIENHLKEVQERSTVDDGFRIYEGDVTFSFKYICTTIHSIVCACCITILLTISFFGTRR